MTKVTSANTTVSTVV